LPLADEVKTLTLLGLAGSLRRASRNRGLLRAAQELAPASAKVEIWELRFLPPYNADDEAKLPGCVCEFRERVRTADGIVIATPEYNYSVPGVLKNAIDWGSQPLGQNSWDGKPVGIMGASNSSLGTARAQYHLRQVLTALNMYALNRPEVLIGSAAQKFDGDGNLTDRKSRELVAEMLGALVEWTCKLRR
jgi:chromate reductase